MAHPNWATNWEMKTMGVSIVLNHAEPTVKESNLNCAVQSVLLAFLLLPCLRSSIVFEARS